MLRITVEETGNRVGSLMRLIQERSGAKLVRGNQLMHGLIVEMRGAIPALALMTLLFASTSYGQQSLLAEHTPEPVAPALTIEASAPAVALSRYIASIQERNPFTEEGPTQVQIDASLPGLAKQGTMLAIRETGASERSEYKVIDFTGDTTVKREVIARYLSAQEQAEALPYSSVIITPANYKFRYVGSVRTAGTTAYVFQIAPKQKRLGLVQGQIWIDSTGIAVRQTGRMVKRPSVLIRRIEVVRDTQLRDGIPYARVTHIAIDTRLLGRADLTVTERPMEAAGSDVVAAR
jgi:hypothetical protein